MIQADKKRYNDFPAFCRRLFGGRVQKLSVDGGFSCPNRDGKKGTGGCTFATMKVLIRITAVR